MNAKELFLMLEAIGDPDQLEHIKIVTKDGRSITGVWTELDQNRIVMVQPDRDEEGQKAQRMQERAKAEQSQIDQHFGWDVT